MPPCEDGLVKVPGSLEEGLEGYEKPEDAAGAIFLDGEAAAGVTGGSVSVESKDFFSVPLLPENRPGRSDLGLLEKIRPGDELPGTGEGAEEGAGGSPASRGLVEGVEVEEEGPVPGLKAEPGAGKAEGWEEGWEDWAGAVGNAACRGRIPEEAAEGTGAVERWRSHS
jgi:hypothetical protein